MHGLQAVEKINKFSRQASGQDLSMQLSSVDDRHIKELMAASGLSRSRGRKQASSMSLQLSETTSTTQERTGAMLHDLRDLQQQLGVLNKDTSALKISQHPQTNDHLTCNNIPIAFS